MGLDWTPMSRPLAGHEQEFEKAFNELAGRELIHRSGILGWLKGKTLTRHERAERIERLREISEAPYETLGAPRVGYDEEADQWLRAKMRAKMEEGASFEDVRRKMHGCYVLDLLPPCDGLPQYSNYGEYEGIDRCSFRAQFLVVIELDEWLAYEKMLAHDLLDYADELLTAAERFAESHGLELDDERANVFDSPEGELEIILAASRWCKFWGERGHGLETWF